MIEVKRARLGYFFYLFVLCFSFAQPAIPADSGASAGTAEVAPVMKWGIPIYGVPFIYDSFNDLYVAKAEEYEFSYESFYGGDWHIKKQPIDPNSGKCRNCDLYTFFKIEFHHSLTGIGAIAHEADVKKEDPTYTSLAFHRPASTSYFCPEGYYLSSKYVDELVIFGCYCHNYPSCNQKIPDKILGDPCPNPTVGNPCNPATGNKYQAELDYQAAGISPLLFKRYYNSNSSVTSTSVGAQWRHNYERRIEPRKLQKPILNEGETILYTLNESDQWTPDPAEYPKYQIIKYSAFAHRPDGKKYYFNLIDVSGNAWVTDADVTGTLGRLLDASGNEIGWRYITNKDEIELYDANGKLLSITTREGRKQTLHYDMSGNLVEVTDDFGRSLHFSYNENGQIATLTDPAGQTFQYGYDAQDNLVSVTAPDGAMRAYLYENTEFQHALTGIVDANGERFASWAYNDLGRVVSSEHAGGAERVTLAYNSFVTTVTDALGVARQYTFETTLGVPRVAALDTPCTDCSNDIQGVEYDSRGFVTSKTDFSGIQALYQHNTRGLEISRTEAAGTPQARTITTEWHPDFRLPTRITEPGRIIEYRYDANGNRLSQTITDTATGESRTTTWTYNQYGQVLTQNNPRSDVADITAYAYDAQGNLTQITNALGQVTQITAHDAHGNPLRLMDANGVVTELEYNVRQRLIRRTVAAGLPAAATTRFAYDPVGQLVQVTLPNAAAIQYEYDAAHRLIALQDALGNRIAYTLDAMGNRLKEAVFGPDGARIRQQARDYNALNRLVAAINGVGDSTGYEYDAEGKRTAVTDAAANRTTYTYDALDRLTRVTDALSGETTYAYNPLDQLTQVADPRGVTTTYNYNAFGNLLAVHSPAAGATTYTYGPAGNRLSQTDARGITATYRYDALNRLTDIQYPDSAENISFGYDQGGYGVGRLSGITGPAGHMEYIYGPRGNVLSDTRLIGSTTLTTGYGYDAADNVAHIHYPGSAIVTFDRDAMGRVTAVNVDLGSGLLPLASAIAYQPFGPVQQLTYGNGLPLHRTFDLAGRLAAQTAGSIQNLAWTYNGTGNITAIDNAISPTRSQTFGYDALYRLTHASGAYGTQSFTYDAVGNRTQLLTNQQTTNYTYATDSNRLQIVGADVPAANYQYDASGNTLSDGLTGYAYNQRNRLTSAERNGELIGRYQYNALGQRVTKTTGQTIDYAALADEQLQLAESYRQQAQALRQQADDLMATAQAKRNEAAPLQAQATELQTQAEALQTQAANQRTQAERLTDTAQQFDQRADQWRSRIVEPPQNFWDRLFNRIYRSIANLFTRLAERFQARADEYLAQASALETQAAQKQQQAANLTTQANTLLAQATDLDSQAAALNQQAAETIALAQAAEALAAEYLAKAEAGEGQMQVTTLFAYGQQGQLLGEYTDTGEPIREYVYLAGVPLAQISAGQVYYYHTDHLGTPKKLTDSTQAIVWDAVYEPFGELALQTGQVEQPLRFPGQYFDQGTGLHYNYFRSYDPATGRYTQSDPIGLRGGINNYVYASSNSLVYKDLLGLDASIVIPFSPGYPIDPSNIPPPSYANSEAHRRKMYRNAVQQRKQCQTRCFVELLNPLPTGPVALFMNYKFGELGKKTAKQVFFVLDGALFIDCMRKCPEPDNFCGP